MAPESRNLCVAVTAILQQQTSLVSPPYSRHVFLLMQAEVQPFSQVFLQFHEHVMSPSLQINSAATAVNEKSLTKLFDFVKTLASCTNTYPPAMAEPITIMVR